jgi:hypothetical protein
MTGSDGGAGDDGKADAGDGSTPSFDLGGGADEGPIPEQGCRAVDFLFVIDNSVSMESEQSALVEAFPGFMAAIQATLEADSDYHIMVTDTDAWGRCNTANGFDGHDPSSNTCNDYIKAADFEECDRALGGGVVHPAGQYASNTRCELQGGNRYIVAGEPDLATAFGCIAQVGVAGHPSERPMDAMVAALAPGINAGGGCNAGFLRDDALLVVTFMSDDPYYEDAEGPEQWFDAVVEAKGGDPSSVVVLGLTPNWPGCQEGKGPPRGQHWTDFLLLFDDLGLHGNVCSTAEEYVAFFEAAVATIDQACDGFVPPG